MNYLEAFCPSRMRAKAVMYFVTDGRPITMSGLSRRIGMDKANLARILPQLEKNGLAKAGDRTASGRLWSVNQDYPILTELRIMARTPIKRKTPA